MYGKMRALHKLFIDNTENCRVTLSMDEANYIFRFEFHISEDVYTVSYELTPEQALHQTLQQLYHIIRVSVKETLYDLITRA